MAWRSRGLPRAWLIAAGAAVLLALVIPVQVRLRAQDAWTDDLRTMARVLERNARPGDAMVFLRSQDRWMLPAYPAAFANLADVTRKVSPNRSGTLGGVQAADAATARRLTGYDRVWTYHLAVQPGARQVAYAWEARRLGLVTPGRHLVRIWTFKGGSLSLWERWTGRPFKEPSAAGRRGPGRSAGPAGPR